MTDGREILSNVSGLPKKEINKIWEEVKANNKRLRNCEGPHQFQLADDKRINSKYRCALCGGTVDTIAFKWYMDGLKHGQKRS